MALLVTIFILELLCHIVLSVGSKTINDLLWQLYCRMPFGPSKDFQDQARLRSDVVQLKREMAGISAQDNFSTWAKVRRQHDKALEQHDKKAEQGKSTRSSFDWKATAVRWACTRGLQIAIQFWNNKTPVFTYPRGWFPWYIEYVLGFPRAPYGGVSINVWSNACSISIALVSELVMYALKYVQEIRSRSSKQKVAMEAKSK